MIACTKPVVNVYIGEKTNGSVICNRTWNIQTTHTNNIVAACPLAMNNELDGIVYLITILVISGKRLATFCSESNSPSAEKKST